ncbi:hypothetical protein [Curtobacterium sp. Leaf261]|uniref:hypothetical protein n=1 Tax=Curtobacterium sp. Leaf261 TaxID=1736311 RepID=UPI0012E1D674|nr:hypothetical protein [Curtobacterium sp. Leaf261]
MKSAIKISVVVIGAVLAAMLFSACSSNSSPETPNIETRLNAGETDKFAIKTCALWKKYSQSTNGLKMEPGVSVTMKQVKSLAEAEGKFGAKVEDDPNFTARSANERVALCKLVGDVSKIGAPGEKYVVVYVKKEGFLSGFVYSK